MNLTALEVAVVKCMHRLSELVKNVVCDVYDVGDGRAANECEAALHPKRRLTDSNVGNIVSDVSRAKVGSGNSDIKIDSFV